MSRRRTSLTNIRNFIGTTSLPTSRPLSITSMLPRVGAGGLQASTATYFVPSVSCAIRGRSHRVVADARLSPLTLARCLTGWVMCEIGHTRWPANTDRFEAGSETQHAPIDRRASLGGGLVAAVFRPPLHLSMYSIALKGCRIVAEGPSHAAANACEIETQCDRLRHKLCSGGFGVCERRRDPHVQDHLWRPGWLRQSDHRDHA